MPKFDTPDFASRYVTAAETSESPLEQLFQMMLEKYLHPDAELIPQAPMKTRRGSFRADFLLITATGERLVLECDGKDYHDPLRDEFRDAFMLADRLTDYVYRFPGYVIHKKIWHALFVLYYQQPGVFSRQGEYAISTRCNHLVDPVQLSESRFAHPPESLSIADQFHEGDELFERPSVILVRAGNQRRGAPLFGVDRIQYARENPGKSVDELVAQLTSEKVIPY